MIARFSWVLGAVLTLLALDARADRNDVAVSRAIREAMATYTQQRDVDAADQALLQAMALCDNQCKTSLVARAWMYVGLVRGSGAGDWETAREAFALALGFDPSVELDPKFFSPTAQALFDGLRSQSEEGPRPKKATKKKPLFQAGARLECSPAITEVQTRRPVPLLCATPMATAERVVVRFRRYGGDDWQRVDATAADGGFAAQIPCSATMLEGSVGFYAESFDNRGNRLERLGSRDRPVVFRVVKETSSPPPHLPGLEPPARCEQTSYCPEGMEGSPACAGPGQGTVGAPSACGVDDDCDFGFSCDDGVCSLSNQCVEDDDCGAGVCLAGRCEALPTEAKLDRFGLHIGADFSWLGASSDVCREGVQGYECYDSGEAYQGTPFPGSGGEVTAGAHIGTARALLTYERFVATRFSLGARLGFAFRGAPDDFFPMHFEARSAFYLGDVTQPRWSFVPYLAASVGVAQIDSRVDVQMVDCRPDQIEACLEREQLNEASLDPETGVAEVRSLVAYKRLGRLFGSAAVGTMIALTQHLSLVANVSVLITTEQESAQGLTVALQPSLGLSF